MQIYLRQRSVWRGGGREKWAKEEKNKENKGNREKKL